MLAAYQQALEVSRPVEASLAETPVSARSTRIDEVRVLMTTLVILHHAAITYGAIGGWYFKEPRSVTPATILLTIFCTINQSYFMGFFFLLAGYFTPCALERKGLGPFVRERLIRLGLPLAFYGFVIGPATIALAATARGKGFLDTFTGLVSRGTFESGPLWFVEALLIFTACYLVWWRIFGRVLATSAERMGAPPKRSQQVLIVGALSVGLVAFLLRIEFKVGYSVGGLQFAYFASYVFLFALGCVSARSSLLENLDRRFALPWCWVTIVACPTLFAYAIAAGAHRGVPFDSGGGLNLPSLAYAFWEPLVAWGAILWFLTVRPGKGLMPRRIGQAAAPLTYAAYIVHPPVLVGCALLAHAWDVSAGVKFAIVGTVASLGSFLVAWAVRKLPGAARIL